MMRKVRKLKFMALLILMSAVAGCGMADDVVALYNVTYDGNGNTGGSVPVDDINYEYGSLVSVLGNTGNLVKTGFVFAGWNTRADGNGTDYNQTSSFEILVDTVLYARWTTNTTYTITYNGNGNTGGSVPADTTNYEQNQVGSVAANTGALVKNGYTFSGWNTQADGSGAQYSPGQSITMGPADVILYAVWIAPVATGRIPDTGQTADYTATFGEDSDYLINPMSYIDNGDGVIIDNVTGLVWQKCSMGQSGSGCTGAVSSYNFVDAGSACGNLTLAGGGWRLPTRSELLTIVNYGTLLPSISATFFPAAPNWIEARYWTSNLLVNSTVIAWYVDFSEGYTGTLSTLNSAYVRCVR